MNKVDLVRRLIEVAPHGIKRILPDSVAGWCPVELGAVLGNLLFDLKEPYLEVGTFCGRSLIYALRDNPTIKATVIDPLPDSMRVGDSTVWLHWNKNIDEYGFRNQITLHRERIEAFNGDVSGIGVAFVDGNHDSGHTYETLRKVKNYLADDAIVIVDDYEIYGGNQQTPFPGYEVDTYRPVKTDTDKFLRDNPEFSVIGYSPWLHWQIYLHFQRRK